MLCSANASRATERTQITIAEASHRLEESSGKDMEPSVSRYGIPGHRCVSFECVAWYDQCAPSLQCLLRRSSGGYSSGDHASDRGCGYASCSSDGEGLSSEAKSLKRRKFEQHRKQHYNMKDALQKCVRKACILRFLMVPTGGIQFVCMLCRGKELVTKELGGSDSAKNFHVDGHAQKGGGGRGSP